MNNTAGGYFLAVSGQAPPAGTQWVSRFAPLEPHALAYDKPLCASLDGFTLPAATRAGALDQAGGEALFRYVLRAPTAVAHREVRGRARAGQHLQIAHRAEAAPEDATPATEPEPPRGAGGYGPWAELVARTFVVDVLACPTCQGRMKLLAQVEAKSLARYLAAALPRRGPANVPACDRGGQGPGSPAHDDAGWPQSCQTAEDGPADGLAQAWFGMNHLEHGRECYGRRAWGNAYHALLCADRTTPLDVDDLQRLATAAYLIGRDLEFQHILERLYRAHVESGDRASAARCAFWLAVTFLLRGESGRSNAWTARGQRLVENRDCVERGYLAVAVAEQQLREGQAEVAHATAGQAVAIGESFGDADLTAAARHAQGRALIQQGDVVRGLKCLDETMLAVVAGELSPIMTGSMYCGVIDTCRQVYALGRAREWTRAFSSVCEQQPEMVAFTGACLVHRAEIMQLQGAWPDALSEARRAGDRAQRAGRKPPGAALYQQAEIHRLCGEFAKAEDAYRAASELGFEPQPGLALLRLAQGRSDAACAAIRRLTTATGDRVRRAGLLPAHLEIMLAVGDVEDARSARDELRELAQAFDTDVLRAVVAQADGAIAFAEGHAHAALDPLRCAFALWERLGAPYEAARVRVLIGHACRALGDDEAAQLELEAAKSVFERLGARPDLARLDAPNALVRPVSRSPLTARELHVLRLISTGRTNRAIAEELSLSERTIDRHVTNILTKLDVRSRTAATTYAYDHRLF